ncbi:hypothetical protein COU78_03895 [Candidatus Peregrinibacteria bacterium CG10_big_fil_rev_8_21_14_0_10_49_24]|nr:MAG: hypothetical protein COV83_00515 [Candidatus Peregrinibacteria bacterium CG11_big_fil_rev_8_21_14_0_20_49_14]PIR50916.1 MAG: hypothetical protein COU78_03895 [Candidatus Peregrinibacteria bacterium CG10_big_fil_rev_8_21_14_0_10_49_24]PJA67341.1 MAG: hypothetical protein CO157_05110 [Candidatus Peregrinibacteria bacterium CG_4_9_14_3_um_filter_49_12]
MIRWRSISASTKKGALCSVFILVLSYCTYVYDYTNPPGFFWDENYHVPSAQKYLNGLLFFEQHPPLGKMLIALGEYIVDANPVDNEMVGRDYMSKVPQMFSFAGYRLIPVLMAWLTAVLFLWVLFLLTKNWLIATALSFLYVFDNALIVHNRGAMLEAPMLFFCMGIILVFLLMINRKRSERALCGYSVLFGVLFGLAFTTKLLGLIMIVLFPAALLALRPHWKQTVLYSTLAFTGFATVFVGVWQLHFSMLTKPDDSLFTYRYYTVSDKYLDLFANGKGASLRYFPLRMKEQLAFGKHYNDAVPRLDLCKNDENGSPFFLWPMGARTIKYRWEHWGAGEQSYLYLVPNPIGWMAGLAGVVLAVSFLLSSICFPSSIKLRSPYLLLVFTGMYVSYLIAVAQLGRVMYLYHYFLPLLFSFILFALVVMEVNQIGGIKITEKHKTTGVLIFACLLLIAHQFFRPLTYNLPLSDESFEKRALLKIWNMRCSGCNNYDSLVMPQKHKN